MARTIYFSHPQGRDFFKIMIRTNKVIRKILGDHANEITTQFEGQLSQRPSKAALKKIRRSGTKKDIYFSSKLGHSLFRSFTQTETFFSTLHWLFLNNAITFEDYLAISEKHKSRIQKLYVALGNSEKAEQEICQKNATKR